MCGMKTSEISFCVAVDIMGNSTMISIPAVDGALCCIHVVLFTVVVISLLLRQLVKPGPVERSCQPSHTARTVLMLTLIAIQVLMLLKDILSAEPRLPSYIASLLTIVGTGAGLVYSDVIGNSRPLAVALLLLLYWFICSALWLLRVIVCLLLQSSQTAGLNVCVLLDTVVLLLNVGLLITECAWIVSNVRACLYAA